MWSPEVVVDVGVRELKEHLSEYLDRAAGGEVIRVTDRGRPKAVIGPLPGTTTLADGIAAGWVREGRDEPPAAVRRHVADRSIAQVVTEDREDR